MHSKNIQLTHLPPQPDKCPLREFKGSLDQIHLIFEINVGKSRIRHSTILKLNSLADSKSTEDQVIQIQSRSMSDPTLSDNDFKNKMAWV